MRLLPVLAARPASAGACTGAAATQGWAPLPATDPFIVHAGHAGATDAGHMEATCLWAATRPNRACAIHTGACPTIHTAPTTAASAVFVCTTRP